MSEKRHHIYLAGNISHDPETYLWREKFEEMVYGWPVVVVNPCANRYNQKHKALKTIAAKKKLTVSSQNILKPKDYQMVKICSVIVMNLAIWTPEKPMVGSIFEFGWADRLMIPVICIVGDESSPYAQHPWIKHSAAAYVETVEDSVELIREYFITI